MIFQRSKWWFLAQAFFLFLLELWGVMCPFFLVLAYLKLVGDFLFLMKATSKWDKVTAVFEREYYIGLLNWVQFLFKQATKIMFVFIFGVIYIYGMILFCLTFYY